LIEDPYGVDPYGDSDEEGEVDKEKRNEDDAGAEHHDFSGLAALQVSKKSTDTLGGGGQAEEAIRPMSPKFVLPPIGRPTSRSG
jgi:hypothetical protein